MHSKINHSLHTLEQIKLDLSLVNGARSKLATFLNLFTFHECSFLQSKTALRMYYFICR